MKRTPDPASREPTEAVLVAEYQSAYAGVLHYDAFRWSAGSMLIAGVFLFWGVVFTNDAASSLFAPASVVVSLVMALWLLYAEHYRQLYLLKLHRIWEIEEVLGLQANRRFVGPNAVYRTAGLSGHTLDRCLFVVVSLGGPLFAAVRDGADPWLLVPVLIVVLSLAEVHREELHVRRLVGASPPSNSRFQHSRQKT